MSHWGWEWREMQAPQSHRGKRHFPWCRERPTTRGGNKKCVDRGWKVKVINALYFYSFFPLTVFLLKNDSLQVVKWHSLSHPQVLDEGEDPCWYETLTSICSAGSRHMTACLPRNEACVTCLDSSEKKHTTVMDKTGNQFYNETSLNCT